MRLDTTIIFTARMEDLAEFYRAGLGHDGEVDRHPGHIGFALEGGVYLGFDEAEESAGPAQRGAGVSLWFDVADLDAAFARFVAAGAEVRYAKKELPMGDTLASLFDLDGNVLGLVSR